MWISTDSILVLIWTDRVWQCNMILHALNSRLKKMKTSLVRHDVKAEDGSIFKREDEGGTTDKS